MTTRRHARAFTDNRVQDGARKVRCLPCPSWAGMIRKSSIRGCGQRFLVRLEPVLQVINKVLQMIERDEGRCRLTLVAVGLAILAMHQTVSTPALAAQSNDFVQLLGGSSLSGWTIESTEAGNFSIQDGILRVEGPGGWLRSDRRFADFTLEVEFRFLTDDADSGVFLRADGVTPFGRGWAGNSYQVQLRDISTNRSNNPIWIGNVYRHRVAEGGETVFDAEAALDAFRPTGEWQEVEIAMIADSLIVRLNGVPITRAYNIVNPSGFIGIQGETGIVEYRSIRVRS
jgi:hypothetical protein